MKTWTYGRWARDVDVTNGTLPDFGYLMLEAALLDFVRNNGLTLVDGPTRHRTILTTPAGGIPAGEAVIIVEVRAAGLLPAQRLPQGWRALFLAP